MVFIDIVCFRAMLVDAQIDKQKFACPEKGIGLFLCGFGIM